jgi:hypothetical protein
MTALSPEVAQVSMLSDVKQDGFSPPQQNLIARGLGMTVVLVRFGRFATRKGS